jgi:hypothetical protein
MKAHSISLTSTILLASALWLNAGEPAAATKSGSPEFERIKSLVGTWQGKTDLGQGPVDLTVQYRLLAAGSVVEEKVFAGTPNEMTTMYFDRDGKLALTHYCMFGNRPGMLLRSSDATTLAFDFDKECGINVAKEPHMHGLTITFVDADTIATSCQAIIDGKAVPEHTNTLKRQKSAVAAAN